MLFDAIWSCGARSGTLVSLSSHWLSRELTSNDPRNFDAGWQWQPPFCFLLRMISLLTLGKDHFHCGLSCFVAERAGHRQPTWQCPRSQIVFRSNSLCSACRLQAQVHQRWFWSKRNQQKITEMFKSSKCDKKQMSSQQLWHLELDHFAYNDRSVVSRNQWIL